MSGCVDNQIGYVGNGSRLIYLNVGSGLRGSGRVVRITLIEKERYRDEGACGGLKYQEAYETDSKFLYYRY